MTEELQSLLDRIQTEGVERAEAEAARIVAEATGARRRHHREAEAQAEATPPRRARPTPRPAASAVGSPSSRPRRDFLLSLQKSIEAVLRETLCDTVGAALTPDVMAAILVRLADAYAAHDMNESRVDVLLSPEDRDAVGAIVMEKYRELVRQGLTLRPDERVDRGFKVSFVDYNLYHDFSARGAGRGAGAGPQASALRHRPRGQRKSRAEVEYVYLVASLPALELTTAPSHLVRHAARVVGRRPARRSSRKTSGRSSRTGRRTSARRT